MASRTFNQFQGTLQKGVVTLFAKVTFDGSGDAFVVTSEVINASTSPVTINPSNGFVGGTTPAIGGAGKYKFDLQDPYVRLLSVTVTEVDTAFSGNPMTQIVTVDDVNNQTAPSLTIAIDQNPVTSLTKTVLLAVTLANSTAL